MIRLAETADLCGIQALMRSVTGFWDESWRSDVLERAVYGSQTIAVVHRDEDVIDGFACAHDVGFRAYLSELVVSPASRGTAISSELVGELERRLADRGCTVIIADAWRTDESFYLSRGWAAPAGVLLRKRLQTNAWQTAATSDPIAR